MNKIVSPARQVKGELKVPASKSHSQRVLAACLLSKGKSRLLGLGKSDDESAALSIIQEAGARIHWQADSSCIIESQGLRQGNFSIHCGESGLSSRLFTPIMANSESLIEIHGHGSLLKRPMGLFSKIFAELGLHFESNNEKLPFAIKGPLFPKNLRVDASLSSQFVSGLLFAYAYACPKEKVVIELLNPTSLPYIEMSLQVLSDFGVPLRFEQNTIYFEGPYQFIPQEISIEADWSSASFLLVAAALKGQLSLVGLNKNSKQADKKLLEVLEAFGAKLNWEGNTLHVQKGDNRPFSFNASDCPDLFPPLAVLAAFAKGESRIEGLHRLASKESDRGQTIQSELGKMGIKLRAEGNALLVSGSDSCQGAEVEAHGDHRIAMACAVAALMAKGPVRIKDAQVVAKSYPDFYTDLASLGVEISEF